MLPALVQERKAAAGPPPPTAQAITHVAACLVQGQLHARECMQTTKCGIQLGLSVRNDRAASLVVLRKLHRPWSRSGAQHQNMIAQTSPQLRAGTSKCTMNEAAHQRGGKETPA